MIKLSLKLSFRSASELETDWTLRRSLIDAPQSARLPCLAKCHIPYLGPILEHIQFCPKMPLLSSISIQSGIPLDAIPSFSSKWLYSTSKNRSSTSCKWSDRSLHFVQFYSHTLPWDISSSFEQSLVLLLFRFLEIFELMLRMLV